MCSKDQEPPIVQVRLSSQQAVVSQHCRTQQVFRESDNVPDIVRGSKNKQWLSWAGSLCSGVPGPSRNRTPLFPGAALSCLPSSLQGPTVDWLYPTLH